ncbi:MAG TPA: peptidase M4 [Thermoanaerobaculia bacterium]
MKPEVPSTAPADAAVAQSREPEIGGATRAAPPPVRMLQWTRGANLVRARKLDPHRRQKNDPLYRPLRIYTIDPSQPKLQGAVTTVNVPYEPLKIEGNRFIGGLFEVDPRDGARRGFEYAAVDLDDHGVLMTQGRQPSPSDPLFHQQMVYAVASTVYNTFKIALGRDLSFGFRRTSEEQPERLRLVPFAADMRNAFYDPNDGSIRFGYFEAPAASDARVPPGGFVFTSLSHDIIAHEVTHALLDGLRTRFTIPTNPDVLAFHEAFADVVAILQHFSHSGVVHAAIRKTRGDMREPSFLTDLANEFGKSTGIGTALRTAIDFSKEGFRKRYDATLESHELGAVLVAAVFETFSTLFQRKTEALLRLASDGTGILPAGDLPRDLQELLAQKASKLANQILTICIRAIDYCPPVDITFGEYLRAVITADTDLVPDDRWGYREAWLDAFRQRGIFPANVKYLSEDAVLWRPPERAMPKMPELSFAELQFIGDPSHPMEAAEVHRQADALARLVCNVEHASLFGLAGPEDPALHGDAVEPPVIESIRSSRRVGPDGQIEFDLIAEITQRRYARTSDGRAFAFYGGATVITGPDGELRYTVVKGIASRERLPRQAEFVTSPQGQRLWTAAGKELAPAPNPFQLLHAKH